MRHTLVTAMWAIVLGSALNGWSAEAPHPARPNSATIVYTELAAGARWGDSARDPFLGARIVAASVDATGRARPGRVLTAAFHSAADPDVNWDGKKILFAAKKSAADAWQIYEMNSDGTGARRIIELPYDCRQPIYQTRIFYLDDPGPMAQLSFVGPGSGWLTEDGAGPAMSLYSVRFDGSGLRRLTYNPSSDRDPVLNEDGRILYSSVQRHNLSWGEAGRQVILAVNLDGTDVGVFAAEQGRKAKRMPVFTPSRQVVFVESDQPSAEGAGNLASVDLRRNLHSYQELTRPADGLYYTPAVWNERQVLVSRRAATGGVYELMRFDLATRRSTPVLAVAGHHVVEAKRLAARPMLEGRSSVVEESDLNGHLYCLSVYETGPDYTDKHDASVVKRVRILEGVPRKAGERVAGERSPLLDKRILGEFDLAPDGSFNAHIPANIPVQVQTLDAAGRALRTSAWIWIKNRENRGCIGCHEDNELAPDNRFPEALDKPAQELTGPPSKRRAVSYDRDVQPILAARCGGACHKDSELSYDALYTRQWVEPGAARRSKLGDAAVKALHRPKLPLSAAECRTIIEWIDMGAHK